MTIDSHVHFWKYDKDVYAWINNDMKTLQQDYYPEHISLTLKRNGIDGVVAVQADQRELETLFLVEMAKTHSLIKGVVGWVDLRDDRLEERLEYFKQFSIIKGWRHIAQSEPDNFLLDTQFQRGISLLEPLDYTYDILIFPKQLKAAEGLVSSFPNQRFVLDHCAKPDIRKREWKEWTEGIQALAKHTNVTCKLSGLLTEAKWKEWSPADFYPCLDVIFESFGTGRLLFGSDWPVMLLSGIYVQWKSLIEKYIERLTEEEKEGIMGLNAQRFYQL